MDEKVNIILVEDDVDLGQILKLYLEIDRFNVFVANSAEKALELFHSHHFSIGILDVNLPKMTGFHLAEKIRESNPKFPFVFLTSRIFKEDKIRGLKIGADDYITKPFDAEELVLRIHNILNRVGDIQHRSLKFSNFQLDMTDLTLTHANKTQILTRREAELLHYLVTNANRIVKTNDILTDIWGKEDYFLGRSMNVFISRLRKYLSLDSSISITNIRGEGYILKL